MCNEEKNDLASGYTQDDGIKILKPSKFPPRNTCNEKMVKN